MGQRANGSSNAASENSSDHLPIHKILRDQHLIPQTRTAIQVITRFSLSDFAAGVSDIGALRNLLSATPRTFEAFKNLHAKAYLFGNHRAIVTSANLTEAALARNHEFGIVSDDPEVIDACSDYFVRLWAKSSANLSLGQLDRWEEVVTKYQAGGGRPSHPSGLADFGANAGLASAPSIQLPAAAADAQQAFVKFLGEATNRVPLTCPISKRSKGQAAIGRSPTGIINQTRIRLLCEYRA